MDKAVESAGLTEFIAALADGLHTVLVDLEKALEIEQILRRLGQIVIAVSHRKDIHLEEYYDKIYYLENGSFLTEKA